MPAKSHLQIDDVEPGRAGRLSGLPTASEVARSRKLAEIGKDLNWYYSELDASRNEHNEPTCAECRLPEKKKLPSGQIKMLTIDTKNSRLVCSSCANKQYKQQQRENVSKRQDREGVPTLQEFWARNRAKLSEAERAQHEEREEDVRLLLQEVETCNRAFERNVPFDEPALQAFIREVCQEIVEHNVILSDITIAPFFKPEMKDFYDFWTSDKSAYAPSQRYYMEFGYVHALPSHVVHPFIAFVEKYLGLSVALYSEYVTRIERIYDALEGRVWKQPEESASAEETEVVLGLGGEE